jgi:hypothetical protein
MGVETVRGFHAYFHFCRNTARAQDAREGKRTGQTCPGGEVTGRPVNGQNHFRVFRAFRGLRFRELRGRNRAVGPSQHPPNAEQSNSDDRRRHVCRSGNQRLHNRIIPDG